MPSKSAPVHVVPASQPVSIPALVSTSYAAEVLGLCRFTVRKLIANGTLKGIRVGHQFRIYRSSLEQLVSGQ